VTLLDSFLLKKEPSGNSQISLILTALATTCVAATDIQVCLKGVFSVS